VESWCEIVRSSCWLGDVDTQHNGIFLACEANLLEASTDYSGVIRTP
jgi:hypothetical protein